MFHNFPDSQNYTSGTPEFEKHSPRELINNDNLNEILFCFHMDLNVTRPTLHRHMDTLEFAVVSSFTSCNEEVAHRGT